jgi:hypothetical protein
MASVVRSASADQAGGEGSDRQGHGRTPGHGVGHDRAFGSVGGIVELLIGNVAAAVVADGLVGNAFKDAILKMDGTVSTPADIERAMTTSSSSITCTVTAWTLFI